MTQQATTGKELLRQPKVLPVLSPCLCCFYSQRQAGNCCSIPSRGAFLPPASSSYSSRHCTALCNVQYKYSVHPVVCSRQCSTTSPAVFQLFAEPKMQIIRNLILNSSSTCQHEQRNLSQIQSSQNK